MPPKIAAAPDGENLGSWLSRATNDERREWFLSAIRKSPLVQARANESVVPILAALREDPVRAEALIRALAVEVEAWFALLDIQVRERTTEASAARAVPETEAEEIARCIRLRGESDAAIAHRFDRDRETVRRIREELTGLTPEQVRAIRDGL